MLDLNGQPIKGKSVPERKTMRQYELTYLISDTVPEAELNKVTGKVGGYISGLGGKILKEEIWGRRKLAYPIKKQNFATYVTLNFDLPADKAGEFEKDLFLSSKIVRHLMIVQDYGEEKLTLTAEDLAATKDITEVIGGEKSFEAVEGMTEESRDLMSVRGDDETEKVEEVVEATEEIKEEKTEEAKAEPVAAEEVKTEKPKTEKKKAAPVKAAKKEKKPEDEADRLSKLDKELDDILGDDL